MTGVRLPFIRIAHRAGKPLGSVPPAVDQDQALLASQVVQAVHLWLTQTAPQFRTQLALSFPCLPDGKAVARELLVFGSQEALEALHASGVLFAARASASVSSVHEDRFDRFMRFSRVQGPLTAAKIERKIRRSARRQGLSEQEQDAIRAHLTAKMLREAERPDVLRLRLFSSSSRSEFFMHVRGRMAEVFADGDFDNYGLSDGTASVPVY